MLKVFVVFAALVAVSSAASIAGVWRGTSGGRPCLLQIEAASFLYMQKGTSSDDTFYFTGGMSQAGDFAIVVLFANSVAGSYSAGDAVQIDFRLTGDSMFMRESTGQFSMQLTRQSANANALFEGGWLTTEGSDSGTLELKHGMFVHFSTPAAEAAGGAIGWFDVEADAIVVTTIAEGDGPTGTVVRYGLTTTATSFTMTPPAGEGRPDIVMSTRPTDHGVNGVWQATTSDGCSELLELSSNVMFRSLSYNCPSSSDTGMSVGAYISSTSAPNLALSLYYGFSSPGSLPSAPVQATVDIKSTTPKTFDFSMSGGAVVTYTQLTTVPASQIVELTLDGDFAAFQAARTQFLNALATFLGVDAGYINLLSAAQGSIVVKVTVQDAPNKSAADAAAQLSGSSGSAIGGYNVMSTTDATPTTAPSSPALGLAPSAVALVLSVAAALVLMF